MAKTRKTLTDQQQQQLIAGMRKTEQERQASYREKALKLFPWVCARCTREFSVRNVRELTVHHRDHNHNNNPPDGRNWELLCIHCHDHEHTRSIQEQRAPEEPAAPGQRGSLSHSPFAELAKSLDRKEKG